MRSNVALPGEEVKDQAMISVEGGNTAQQLSQEQFSEPVQLLQQVKIGQSEALISEANANVVNCVADQILKNSKSFQFKIGN